MKPESTRLYFIDAIRAWAILMMLQGHFIDGLLDPVYRDGTNIIYNIWRFFRGITAPVFFTVSGFIFMYLLIKENKVTGDKNSRILKGIKRGLMLIGIGYLLRLNIIGLFSGIIYDSFYVVDVLHCIGLSLIFLSAIFSFSRTKKKYILPLILGVSGFLVFLIEPAYKLIDYSYLPDFIANFLSKQNGSVFTIFPWFGYAAIGAFTATLFHHYKHVSYFYLKSITLCFSIGYILTFYSSYLFILLFDYTQIQLFADIFNNNYLFIRLGNVFLIFAIFMIFRNIFRSKLIFNIGKNTLYIYVIHFIVLYGSFTGLGLYKFLHHKVAPLYVISGAIVFLIAVTYAALMYAKNKKKIILLTNDFFKESSQKTATVFVSARTYLAKIKSFFIR